MKAQIDFIRYIIGRLMLICFIFLIIGCKNKDTSIFLKTSNDTVFLQQEIIIQHKWVRESKLFRHAAIIEFLNDTVIRQYKCPIEIYKEDEPIWEIYYNGFRFEQDSICLLMNIIAKEDDPGEYFDPEIIGTTLSDICYGIKCFIHPYSGDTILIKYNEILKYEFRILKNNELNLENITSYNIYN